MKAGFFSPLPPARTGVADYSAALLGAMRRTGEVLTGADGDVALYHTGNNHLHREIYRRALERPGVVVIHDAVLHHFFLGTLTEEEYIREFTFNYGVWTEELARGLWRDRARSGSDPRYFQYPMLKRIAESARAIIVHNPAAGKMVREHAPGAKVHEIPHLFETFTLPPGYEVERLRRRLGCGAETLLVGVFGHLRESKRLWSVLRAFERLQAKQDVRLIVGGEFASSDLARAMEPWRKRAGILWTGYLSDADFWRYACAVDVCVNLRYPAAGETSGIAIRLMGVGKTVIVSEGLETSRFPENACLRAEAGLMEEETVASYLEWLCGRRGLREEMGRQAAVYIGREHGLERVACAYWKVLQDCYDEGTR